MQFPYFFVGTFIEARRAILPVRQNLVFPYFFVGTFIEACKENKGNGPETLISLLFRRDFH